MDAVVVCGLGRFGLQVVEALRGCGCPVTVVSDSQTHPERIERAEAAGARFVRGDFRTHAARREAEIGRARAVMLTTASDVANLEAALEIRGEAPAVRIVMRHSQPRLARRFETDFGIAAALAPADLAAPAFVAAALAAPASSAPASSTGRPDAMPRRPVRTEFVAIPLLLAGIYAAAIVIFKFAMGLTWIDATYFTTTIVTTVGFGDINLHQAPAWLKLFGVGLMFAGVLRCFDADLARRIHAVSADYTLLSEAKIAAEVFVHRVSAAPTS